MKFNQLLSIVASGKEVIEIDKPTQSFRIEKHKIENFVPPDFDKVAFEIEKPRVLLVSAVGCAGKSTTAKELSRQAKMPLLDLAANPAVGDNTVTGLLTTVYSPQRVSQTLSGFSKGQFGMIIDGLDEGRTKTKEPGFEAFLDNIVSLASDSPNTAFVLLGRGQVLESVWCYLSERVSTGLVSMRPFSEAQAKLYVDKHISAANIDTSEPIFGEVRQQIFERLKNAFSESSEDHRAQLLGYPPVLDSIVTLLSDNQNFYKLSMQMQATEGQRLEVRTLIQILSFLMDREHEAKAVPNFLTELANKAGNSGLTSQLFLPDEQCGRVLKHVMKHSPEEQRIGDPVLNADYEERLSDWLPDHPFLNAGRFRNPVFESLVVWKCLTSKTAEYARLAEQYAARTKLTYHLFLMADDEENDHLPLEAFGAIVNSAAEFVMSEFIATSELDGCDWQDAQEGESSGAEAIFEIVDASGNQVLSCTRKVPIRSGAFLRVGPVVANLYITAPVDLSIESPGEIEVFGDCEITVRDVVFSGVSLTAVRNSTIIASDAKKALSAAPAKTGVNINCRRASGSVDEASVRGTTLAINSEDPSLHYPLVNYTVKTGQAMPSKELKSAYRRLRRILLQFKSHSKGQLAKYKPQIHQERTLGGWLGESILNKLIELKILTSDHTHYFVDPAKLNEHLAISWQQLRRYETTVETLEFLEQVNS